MGGWVVEHLTTMSNSNASCFRVGLSWVELRWVLTKKNTMYTFIDALYNLHYFLIFSFEIQHLMLDEVRLVWMRKMKQR